MGRPLRLLLLIALAAPRPLPAARQEAAPDLAAGVQQVDEGDFEGAVTTLQAVVAALAGKPGRQGDLARAHLYLGVAHVALDQRDAAKADFRAALGLNPDLRLSAERFSPKVIAVFEEARREAEAASRAAGAARKGSGKPLVWVALGGAVAGAIALAATRGGGPVTITNARFTIPVIVCPNGSVDVDLPYSILVDVDNRSSESLTVESVTTIAVIERSDIPSEVGFSSQRPSTVVPSTVAARSVATLQVGSSLLCGNGAGDPARSNTWLARLSFVTGAGAFNVETIDRMRVDVP